MRLSRERSDKKLDGLRMRKEIDMSDGVECDVSAVAEAPNPIGRNICDPGVIDLPAALGGNDQIVGRPEELVHAGVDHALQNIGARVVVGNECGGGSGRRPGRALQVSDWLAVGG